jgi:NAD+ synthetase
MPSAFSSLGSVEDSKVLCRNLGVVCDTVPIADLYSQFAKTLSSKIGWNDSDNFGNDNTEENIQARTRGLVLMAYSNKKGGLVLSTGNKSELAVGYCTLYGDMVGGLGVISDVPKVWVYRLAEYINTLKPGVIPSSIITKAPSAELRPGQVDQDSLPPYEILDEILKLYIEEGFSMNDIVNLRGFERETVSWVIDRVKKNEFKRRLATIGLKVTGKAFGSGRRMPIATNPALL